MKITKSPLEVKNAFSAVVFLLLGLSFSLQAGNSPWSDWPHWLGPLRNGSSPEKGLLREWPEEGMKQLWLQKVPKGEGSVCVFKGQIFISGAAAFNGIDSVVCCLDAFSGKLVWKSPYKFERKPAPIGWGYCARDTISATEKYVYHMNEQGPLICLNRITGEIVWTRDLDAEYKPSHSDWNGFCMSPFAEDGIIFQPVGGDTLKRSDKARYFGIDAATGKNTWDYAEGVGTTSYKEGGASTFQTPALMTLGNDKCAVVIANGKIFGIRISDGKKLWTRAGVVSQLSTILVSGSYVLVSQNMTVFKVTKADPSPDDKPLWKHAEGSHCITPVIKEGFIYALVDVPGNVLPWKYTLKCIELETGIVKWEQKGFESGASIMLADGLLFIRTNTTLMLVEANPEKYVQKGKMEIFSGTNQFQLWGWVMPTLAYGRLFVRTESTVFCFQAAEKVPRREEIMNK